MLKNEHSVWTPAGYGAWMETALDPPENMREFSPEAVFLVLDQSHAAVDDVSRDAAIVALESAFPVAAVMVVDVDDLAYGVDGFYDERMWKIASMPWSMKGLQLVKGEMGRLLDAMKGGRKKVLALDFDNTLWAGVVGEDGPGGVRPFVELQSGIKRLQGRGVLLVGVSKNNPEDVEQMWGDGRMVLEKEDFAALRVNWGRKPENLSSLAGELGLGVDSFVFLDDNPAEREEMRATLPEVAVPDFPADERSFPRFLRRLERIYFPRVRLTEEDAARTARYRAESSRRSLAAGLSVDEYLEKLGMWADVHPVRDDEVARVAQLCQRANQFNVLANRHSAEDISRFARDGGRLVLAVRAGDRFGEMGIVAFVNLMIAGDEAKVADWVMSCRAMNRRLEFAVEDRMEEMLCARGVKTIRASWRRTAKNAPSSHLFDSLGFSAVESTAAERHYFLALPASRARRHFVKMKGG